MGEVGLPRPLTDSDDRENFDCGRESLNYWFRRHAWRNQRDGLSRTTILVDEENGAVAAYVSLCTAEVAREFLPKAEQRNRPDPIPAVLLGQLAVDRRYQGRQYARSLIVLPFKPWCACRLRLAATVFLQIRWMKKSARSIAISTFAICPSTKTAVCS
jgi:hypothetical protein